MFHNIKTSLLLIKLGDWLLKTLLGGCHLLSGSLERLQHGVHAGEEGCRAESVHQELPVVPSTGYFATHQKSFSLMNHVQGDGDMTTRNGWETQAAFHLVCSRGASAVPEIFQLWVSSNEEPPHLICWPKTAWSPGWQIQPASTRLCG